VAAARADRPRCDAEEQSSIAAHAQLEPTAHLATLVEPSAMAMTSGRSPVSTIAFSTSSSEASSSSSDGLRAGSSAGRSTAGPLDDPRSDPQEVTGSDGCTYRWRACDRLGKGSYGRVYEGVRLEPSGSSCPIAVKVMRLAPIEPSPSPDEASSSCVTEAQVLAEVEATQGLDGHANVLRCFGSQFDRTNGLAYIFLELCSGGTLSSKKPRSGGMLEADARPYLRAACAGVALMHSRGLVHGDVKPDNLLDGNGDLKVADFGLARALKRGSLGEVLNVSGGDRRLGTPTIAAPEKSDEHLESYAGKPTDAWSLGIVAFWTLAGFYPFLARAADPRFDALRRAQATGDTRSCELIYARRREHCPFSREAREMIDGLLVISPDQRLTVEQALASAFFALGQ
jgi:serine/threonine protein kinase